MFHFEGHWTLFTRRAVSPRASVGPQSEGPGRADPWLRCGQRASRCRRECCCESRTLASTAFTLRRMRHVTHKQDAHRGGDGACRARVRRPLLLAVQAGGNADRRSLLGSASTAVPGTDGQSQNARQLCLLSTAGQHTDAARPDGPPGPSPVYPLGGGGAAGRPSCEKMWLRPTGDGVSRQGLPTAESAPRGPGDPSAVLLGVGRGRLHTALLNRCSVTLGALLL